MKYKKYLLLLPYLVLCGGLWVQRGKLYAILPPLLERWTLDLIFAALAFVGLVFAFENLRCPFWIRARAERTFQQAGLKNSQGEYPVLLSVYADPYKKHGKIYKLRNRGLSPVSFDEKVDRLQTGLGGAIGTIEDNKNTRYTLLSFLPKRYVKPIMISPGDNAFGSIAIEHLINLLVVGATGTGKTAATKILLYKIAAHVPNAVFTILDYKQQDFAEFAGLSGYYGYSDCVQGLEDYYASFKAQQATGKPGVPHYLVIDEWGAFILSQEKKQAEQLRAKLAELLMLGRSYNYRVICGLQRADSSHFVSGARDQFRAILALGNLSKEQKQMLFPEDKERMTAHNGQGEGYLFIDGKGIERIKVERVGDFSALSKNIWQAMSRGQPGGAGGEAKRKPPDTL